MKKILFALFLLLGVVLSLVSFAYTPVNAVSATPAPNPADPNLVVAEPLTGAAPIPGPYELYGLLLCGRPGFKCISVKSTDTWASLFPDEKVREEVMRFNRTNVDLKYRHWLVIPENLSKMDFKTLAPLPQHVNTLGQKLLIIDLDKYAFGAYDPQGNLVYWGPTNGGADYCPEMHGPCRSVSGRFRIYKVQGPDCTSSEYPIATTGGAPMPWCMHYFKGYAIHASTLTGFANRSRGCIRLFYDDAKWLNQNFVTVGTQVEIHQQPLANNATPATSQLAQTR